MPNIVPLEEKYNPINKNLRYYIVYNAEGEEVTEGTFYEILDELKISEMTFLNYCRPKDTSYEGSYQIIELLPDEGEDEIKGYYDCLLEIKERKISYVLILKVIALCEQRRYLEGLAKNDLQLGLFNYDMETSIPEVVAVNLILQTYALLFISEELTLCEVSDYYNVPFWLVEVIDAHYDTTFEY